MTDKEILDWCLKESAEKEYITFPEEIYKNLSRELAETIAAHLEQTTLMKLPESELHFFKWLRNYDRPVWDDLWGGVDEDPYTVGDFIPPDVSRKGRALPNLRSYKRRQLLFFCGTYY
jgi:hypothetical protein